MQGLEPSLPKPLFDMHCHLGFAPDAAAIAQEVAARGEGMLSCGVDPSRFAGEEVRYGSRSSVSPSSVRVGLGLHPWWVERVGAEGLGAFLDLLPEARFVGEIGIDRGARHGGNVSEQAEAFTRICRALTAHPGKVVSIHAVRSVDVVIDTLEATGALHGNVCILHWFSGTSQQLTRAVRAGCHISLGTFSLSTKRGKAYARQVPAGKLLLETDYPPEQGEPLGYEGMHAPLQRAAEQLAEACGRDALEAACAESKRLLGL